MQSTQQTPSPLSPLSSPQQSNESVNSNNSNVKSDPFDLNSAAIIPRPSSLGLNQMSLGTSTHNESTSNESSNDESNNHNHNSAQTADHNQAPQNDNCDESAPSPRDSANVKRESMRPQQQQPPQSQPLSAPIDDHQMHAQLPPQFRSSGSYQHHPYPHHHVPPPPMLHPHPHQHPLHHPYLPLQPSYHQSFAIQYSPFSGPRTPLHAQPPPPHFAQAQQPRSNMDHHHHHHHHPQFPPNPFAHSNGTGSNGHKPITMATSTTSTTPKLPVSSAPNSNDEQQLSSQSSSQTNIDEEHQQLPEEEVAEDKLMSMDADKKLVPVNHFQPLLFPPMLNNGLPMLQRAPSLIANNTNSNVINEDDIFGNNHSHTHTHNHNHNHSNSHYHHLQQQQFVPIVPEPLHNASAACAAGVPPLPPPPPPMGNCNRMPSVTPNMIFNFNYYAPNMPMPAGIPPIPDIYTQALPQQQQLHRRSDSVTSKSSRDSKESSHRLILKQKRKSSPKKAADRKRKRKSPRKHVRKHVSYPNDESGEEEEEEEEGVEADIERGKRVEYDAEYFEEMDEGVAVEEYEFDEEDEAAYQQAEAEGESFASAPPAVKKRKLCRDKPSNTNRNGSRKEERHICSYCQKSFVHNCHLARHIREKHVTSPLRPAFECRICDKVFNQRSNLKVHLRSHALDESVSRPWLCQQCYPNRRFTRKSSLKRHWTKKHKAVAKRLIAELDLAEAQAEAEAEAAENFDDTHQSDVKEEIVSIKHEPITVHDLSVPPEVFYSLPPHDNSLPPPLIG